MIQQFDRSIEVVKAFFCRTDPELDSCIEALAPYLEASGSAENDQVNTSLKDFLNRWPVVDDPLTGQTLTITRVRFNFKEVLRNGGILEVFLPPLEIVKISDHYLKAVGFALLFLRTAQELTCLEIGSAEAQVLTAMIRLEQAHGVVTQDDIETHLYGELTRTRLESALSNLEALGCIAQRQDEVILKETIEIAGIKGQG